MSQDTTDEEIRRIFQERHGCEPEEIVRDGTIVKAGPIPDQEAG